MSDSMLSRDAALLKRNVSKKYDVIVIGSGAGGAVVAKELAEGGAKVAIVEEGGEFHKFRDLASDALGRLYRDKGFVTTIGSSLIPVAMGTCFGGTTVINSGTCFRVPKEVFESWHSKHGLTDLDKKELDHCYERVEQEIHVEPADFEYMSRSNTQIHELLAKEGFRGRPLLRNTKNCKGCGMCCYGCDSGAKQSMDVTYLPKAVKAGAVAYTHSRVTHILTDSRFGGRACGVVAEGLNSQLRRTGYKITLHADRVILAGGTFPTPQLLKANKIARGNKHVGRHLTLHPATKVFADFDEVIKGWEGIPQAYYLDAFHDQGLMFEGIFTPPDIAGFAMPFGGRKLTDFMKRYPHMSSFGFMISDESEGRLIRLPFFGYTYLYSLTAGDIRRIQKGVAFLARLFLKGGANRVYPLIRHWEFGTLEDVDLFEKTTLRAADVDCMAFHPLGTCRMSASVDAGVCDQNHEVYGTPGLFICDGSVIPSALGVNPQLTIMAFATRLAGMLLQKKLGPV